MEEESQKNPKAPISNPITQEDIFFSEHLTENSSKLLLFDLPPELLNELENRSLHLGGEANSEAIISGSQSSFLIRKNETTNSLLILEDNIVQKISHDIYICEKIIPPLHQIYGLLNESPYTSDDIKRTKVYSYMELAEKVQASDSEIKEYLKKINGFEFRGYWRIFDEEYRIEVLKNIMCKLMEKDWPDVKVRLISQEFPEIPYEILLALLKTIGSVDRDTFTADKLKVYQMCAFDLFITNNEYLKEEFETAFKNLTNMVVYRKYINTSLNIDEILEGIAVFRLKNYSSSVKYLNRYQLTYNLEERLNLLFSIKPRWTEKELRVYLSDVSIITLPQLLLRHTKKVIEGSTVLYASKLN